MLNPGVVYMSVSLVLFAVAVVVHYHSKHLSLPISPIISVLAAILPITAFINAYIYPSLLRYAHGSASQLRSTNRLKLLCPIALQAIQGLVTVVLATLLLEGIIPSSGLECLLERDWMDMFRTRDGEDIKYVQDTYKCCGLDAIDDRAYPFPGNGTRTCADIYDRKISCKKPWKEAMQATSGVDLGVVLVIGMLQVVGLLIMREGTNWWTASRTSGWKWFMTHRELSRPLLSAPEYEDDVTEPDETQIQAYGSVSSSESASRAEPSRNEVPNA